MEYEIVAIVKIDPKTNNDYIQFKTANALSCKDSSTYLSKVLKKVSVESLAFSGVDITTALLKPDGDFKLYGRHYFSNSSDEIFYWIGVDTENWKGWSMRIVKDDSITTKLSSDINYEIWRG